jgi:hypothetical protein
MNSFYTIETRQRLRDAAHYGEWRDVPEGFKTHAAARNWGAYMVKQSHSLDIRIKLTASGTLIETLRDEGDLPA